MSEEQASAEPLILRDYLALDRTMLANERTLLAYLRTAIMLLISALPVLELEPFKDSAAMQVLGWLLLPLGCATALIGVLRFRQVARRIKAAGRPGAPAAPPPEGQAPAFAGHRG